MSGLGFSASRGLFLAAAVTGLVASCAWEEEYCFIEFTGAVGESETASDTCEAESYLGFGLSTRLSDGVRSVEIDFVGDEPLSVGTHTVDVQYWDGENRWEHDGGSFYGIGPECVVEFTNAKLEQWTKTDRLRLTGTLTCDGILTNVFDEQASLEPVRFDMFVADDIII